MTITLPDTVEGFEDVLGDDRKLAAMFSNGRPLPEFGDFVRGYVEKITARDSSIEDQIKDEVNKVFAEFLKDNKDASPVRKVNLDPRTAPPSMGSARAERYRAIYNEGAPGAKAEGMFKSFGDYARATWHKAGSLRDGADLMISIRLTPKSSRERVGGLFADAQGQKWLQASVTAPPVRLASFSSVPFSNISSSRGCGSKLAGGTKSTFSIA